MLAPETVTFLGAGRALVVGTVGPDGEPHVARGWGLTPVTHGEADVRLVLDAGDTVAIDHLSTTGRIAVTGGDVRTLESKQFKGHAVAIEAATDADRALVARFCDDFFGQINAVDGTARPMLDRLVPVEFVACLVRVAEVYDQSPGPGAGTPLAGDVR